MDNWPEVVLTLLGGGALVGLVQAWLKYRAQIAKLKHELEQARTEAPIKARTVEVEADKVEVSEREADMRAHDAAVRWMSDASAVMQTMYQGTITNLDERVRALEADNAALRADVVACQQREASLRAEMQGVRDDLAALRRALPDSRGQGA